MLKKALRFIFTWLFKVEVTVDSENLRHNRTLIVANHQSFLDGFLIWLFVPIDATFVIHQEITNLWFLKPLLKFVPHLSVASTSPFAMKQALHLLESGRPVVIFPEGRITSTSGLMKVYEGSAFLAAKAGAAVIPVRIEGALYSKLSRMKGILPQRWFPKLRVNVQAPEFIPMPDLPSARLRRHAVGEQMTMLMQHSAFKGARMGTLFSTFLDARDRFGGKYGFVRDLTHLEDSNLSDVTYDEILKKALGTARVISRLTERGECVGVLLPNVAGILSVIMGLSAMGRVPAMLNYTAGRDGILAACTAAKVTTILTSKAFLEKAKLTEVVQGLPGVKVLYSEDLRMRLTLGDKAWVALHMLNPRLIYQSGNPDETAVVLFTSGTESKPKGVVHTHRSILSNIAQVHAIADFSPKDKFFVALPLFHCFGFTCGSLLPLFSGIPLTLFPNPLNRAIPEVVYNENCNVMFGTSTFLASYGKNAHPYDFARMRYVIAGAEKLSPAVEDLWRDKFGVRILEGYGVTECAPVIAVNTPMANKRGTVGRLLPHMEHRLESVPGIEEGGLLLVKGPNVMKGYLKFEAPGVLEPPAHEGEVGWYSTGDIVAIDAEGYVRILGRVKRFANVAGEKVSLETVERLGVQAAPDGQHAAVAIPQEGRGEVLVLFSTAAHLTVADLQRVAKETGVPMLAVPKTLIKLDKIPLLGTGKVDYVSLNKMATSPVTKAA